MKHDSRHMLSINDGEQGTVPHSTVDKRSSPISPTGESGLRTLRVSELAEQCQREINAYRRGDAPTDVSGVELLRRATVEGDQEARASFQQCLGEVVSGWLRRHPRWDAAVRLDSEENFVTQAFTRFWQATPQQWLEFNTLAAALRYLRASLNGALLDTLRAYMRTREGPLPEPGASGEPSFEDRTDSGELWKILQRVLPSELEQRLVYLLYHCGLRPREILHCCPQEWSDVQEIYRLRRTIVERLLHHADSFLLLTQSPRSSCKERLSLEEKS